MPVKIPELPVSVLSEQQKSIYDLARQGISNKEISKRLGLDPRHVSNQLSRIRKKAKEINFTYKIEPGAEHTQNTKASPLQELQNVIKNDPGYVSLIYQRYGTESKLSREVRSQSAASGLENRQLYKQRAKHLRTLVFSNKNSSETVLLKLNTLHLKKLRGFIAIRELTVVDRFWDDESIVCKVTRQKLHDLETHLK